MDSPQTGAGAERPAAAPFDVHLRPEPMVGAVLLASGFARRMGRSKLTLRVGGRPLLERALDALVGAERVARRMVVLQPADLRLLDRTRYPSVEPIANPLAAEGQSAAIRLATEALAADPAIGAIIFCVVDQPFLEPAVLDRLAGAWAGDTDAILVSQYGGQRGNPVLFGRRYFPELLELRGDVGGREILRVHPDAVREVSMADPAAGQDVDTWDDLKAARARARRRRNRGQPSREEDDGNAPRPAAGVTAGSTTGG
ncbi:MAG TPA: nucleotidyltransferase family protein [bacterium]|nr:nucleotidyltransferase family protein [bacterium]